MSHYANVVMLNDIIILFTHTISVIMLCRFAICHYTECHAMAPKRGFSLVLISTQSISDLNAECCILFIEMIDYVTLNVIMLCVVAPKSGFPAPTINTQSISDLFT
jgi:hypothetical protein